MGNMSYCRFQNTVRDLQDCEENLNDHSLSKEETRARRELVETCYRILETLGATIEEDVDTLSEFIPEEENEEDDN